MKTVEYLCILKDNIILTINSFLPFIGPDGIEIGLIVILSGGLGLLVYKANDWIRSNLYI